MVAAWSGKRPGVATPRPSQATPPPHKKIKSFVSNPWDDASGDAAAEGGGATGEIRMATADETATVVENLDGSMLGGAVISVAQDQSSKDGTKVVVTGIPAGVVWQELKDHFSQFGQVKFANIKQAANAGAAPGTIGAEVRYDSPEELQAAVAMLEGSEFKGHTLSIVADANSKDGTKCSIFGLPMGTEWQDVKDHCAQAGRVAFCEIKGQGGDSNEAEVRYDDPAHAVAALALDGSLLMGSVISVQGDPLRQDKLKVFGIPPGAGWQELKDHFGQIGQVAFADIKKGAKSAGMGVNLMAGGLMSQMVMMQGHMMGMKGGNVGGMVAYGGGAGYGAGMGAQVGEVRFDDPSLVYTAVEALNGSTMGGATITVKIDQSSKDMSKIIVSGIPPGLDWRVLKDHFSSIGQVAYASIKPGVGVSFPSDVAAFGGGAGFGAGSQVGEVRFEDPSLVHTAVEALNGSTLGGALITVTADTSSKDSSKVMVQGIPPGLGWQQLKDHFASIGQVAYANIKAGGAGGMGGVGGLPISMAAFGGGAGFGAGAGGHVGEVRFEDPSLVHSAVEAFNGSTLGGARITVRIDVGSKDASKVIVSGIPLGLDWRVLKDHFSTLGQVAYANIKPAAAGGGGQQFAAQQLQQQQWGNDPWSWMMKGMMMAQGKGCAGGFTAAGPSSAKGMGNAGGFACAGAGCGRGGSAGAGAAGAKGGGKGEVRYDHAQHAQQAIQYLNGSWLGGSPISVTQDPTRSDKVWVSGVPSSVQWQELKDHFGQIGQVAFANMTAAVASAKPSRSPLAGV